MTLSAAVMAHPKRADMVEALTAELDRPVPVVWDTLNDRHDTGIRSVEAFDPSASHHLVLQDDALVCRDLLAGIERMLRYVPQCEPVSLYVGRVRPFANEVAKAVQDAQGASWLTMQGIYWGPAIILPTVDIPALSDWYRKSPVKNYDRRISTWYALRNATVWYSWPSLVDHRDTDSLISGHGKGRTAHKFLGCDQSAMDVDWSGQVIHLPRTAKMDNARQLRAKKDNARQLRAKKVTA